MRPVISSVASGLTAVLLAATLIGCGPLGPIPGGKLRGEPAPATPPGWDSALGVEQIQVETNPADPHSVNTWCIVHEGGLYVPTSLILGADEPSERRWVRNVLEDPRVRVRIDGAVYELRATKVEDSQQRDVVRAALLEKYDVEPDAHSDQAWIFRMEPRRSP